MSRKGELWRGEIAQHIEQYLDGSVSAEDLTDWAADHPFFEDRTDLDVGDQRLVAMGLARALLLDAAEPEETRTTEAHLRAALEELWSGRRPQTTPTP